MSIPGIGQFTAWLLVAELDDIKHFRNAKKLAAYPRLVPQLILLVVKRSMEASSKAAINTFVGP